MSAVKGRKTVSDLRPPIAAIEDVLSGERRWIVALANSLELLPQLPDNCIDSCVVDPPYELGFMGKSWDNRGISFDPETWRKVLRVLKPGGHLLSFGGTRTVHRIAVAIEDAGFEIRDCILTLNGDGEVIAEPHPTELAWMYGSG